jgi:murein L,D-transpeptidase YcbB/YkuD
LQIIKHSRQERYSFSFNQLATRHCICEKQDVLKLNFMKNLTVAILLCIASSSCRFVAGEHEAVDSSVAENADRYSNQWMAARDTSIDSTNAYNNFFLDTASVNSYITNNKLSVADSQAIKGFYNQRNYQYAWFASDGMTEQGRSFWNAYTYATAHGQKDSAQDTKLALRMDTIVDIDTLMIAANDSTYLHTEVALTHRFIHYYRNADSMSLIHRLPLTQLLPVRKMDALVLADSVLKSKPAMDTGGMYAPYTALQQQLARYDSIAKKGGWQPITARAGSLREGSTAPVISAIKKRLQLTGEYRGSDTTTRYTDSLDVAIRAYQQHNGFKENGVITDSLLAVMNVPVQQRIEQILINLNRMAWIPPQVKDNYVAVNIPEFMLEVHEGDSIPVKMEVIVGKEGTNTMMFTGDLNQVVFSPSWKLPPSIVKNEILPAMKKNANYLKLKNMEVVKQNDSLPEIRQLPGAGNALGKVKFLFPNSYDIYLHDTEAKGLFAKSNRAFSHGCIRLADAEKMSEYVLRNDTKWTADKIKLAMNSNKELPVAVSKPLPVVITYFTSWVDDKGMMHFGKDIYAHDKRTSAMMFKKNMA